MKPIEKTEENKSVLLNNRNTCDKYDILIALGAGAIGGIIDIFLVGAPNQSLLGNWTDKQVENVVMKFAKHQGWNPKEGKEKSVASAIGFLEKKFKINYDQRSTTDVNNLFKMGTKNHHMKSLAHSPSILGLFFSILNQFTSTSTFLSDGKLITIKTETFELEGGNLPAKIFCGFTNWFGHLMSDVAGSSGSQNRGTGIVIPFFELFGLCDFGKFQINKDRQNLATLATRVFQEGYDFRHGITMSIPVFITELIIKLTWYIKQIYCNKKSIKECFPSSKHQDLRFMLLVGHGTLCVMDSIDAGIKSNGNALTFCLRLNLMAWYRLFYLVIKEICIQLGLAADFEAYIESWKCINEELERYYSELEKIDLERYNKEVEQYQQLFLNIKNSKTEKELNSILHKNFELLGIENPYEGSFDSFMNDQSEENRLRFK